MDVQDESLRRLKEYFQQCEDATLAFLFGSRAKEYARTISDWDIAVYINEENRDREQEMWSDVEQIVGAEVDLVMLNRAPASLAWTIFRTGIPLVIKDRRQYISLMLQASHEANAWYYTTERYQRIFERSASLSQEDRERLGRTMQFLEQEVADFAKFQSLTWQEYEKDRAKKREVERWAEQLVNAAIDVSEIILASERRVMPETYRMMLRTLGTVAPFDKDDMCEQLAQWTELRNILAHQYIDYRWKELSAFLKETEQLWLALIERIKEFLKADAPS